MLTIIIKIDPYKKDSWSDEGGQDGVEEEVDEISKRNAYLRFPNFQAGKGEGRDKTRSDEESISLNGETAELKQDGMHG